MKICSGCQHRWCPGCCHDLHHVAGHVSEAGYTCLCRRGRVVEDCCSSATTAPCLQSELRRGKCRIPIVPSTLHTLVCSLPSKITTRDSEDGCKYANTGAQDISQTNCNFLMNKFFKLKNILVACNYDSGWAVGNGKYKERSLVAPSP